MASCKDCLSCKVCYHTQVENLPECTEVRDCEHFKDRNRFIELPTTLGKEFYTIERYGGKKRVRWCFAEEITICTVRGIKNGRYDVLENCFDFKVKPLRKKAITNMNNIFQTYEEAERVLNNPAKSDS